MDIKKLVRDIASSVRGDGPYKNSDEVEVAIQEFAKREVDWALHSLPARKVVSAEDVKKALTK